MSPDQIQLSALKGEGELKNLELNEEVLTELLELPSWLRLSGATCNRVAVRIQWTKLKSVPIQLSLDEVSIYQSKRSYFQPQHCYMPAPRSDTRTVPFYPRSWHVTILG